MTVIHILMAPQYLHNNRNIRNNISRHSIGSSPNNGTQLLRSTCVDIPTSELTNKSQELVSKQVLSIPV